MPSLLARYRYNSGLIDFQSVLQTQVTLLSVEDSVANAQARDWRRPRPAVQGAGRGLAARVRGAGRRRDPWLGATSPGHIDRNATLMNATDPSPAPTPTAGAGAGRARRNRPRRPDGAVRRYGSPSPWW